MSTKLQSPKVAAPALNLSRGVSLLDMILPPQAAPLLGLLLLIVPMVLLTGESLFIPLFEWVKSRLITTSDTSFSSLPLHFFIKLFAFIALSFLGGIQLLLRIKTIYYSEWARAFPRPHLLHVDYQPDPDRSMVALLQWKLYQAAIVLAPPLVMALVTTLVGLLFLYLFNTFSDISFVGLSIQFTVEIFIMMMLGLFTAFAFLNSIWNAFTTLYGDVVAVTEPDLPNPIILQRCGRIAFASPYIYILFPAYFLLILATLGEVIWLLSDVDVHQLIRFEANVPLILLLEVVTLAWYLGFSFFKFYTYHHGMMIYYNKLPQQLKDCFTPPPAADRSRADNPQYY